MKAVLVYGYNDNYLEGSLIHSFSRLILVEPMTTKAMGFWPVLQYQDMFSLVEWASGPVFPAVGIAHDIHSAVAQTGISCWAKHYCGSYDLQLGNNAI